LQVGAAAPIFHGVRAIEPDTYRSPTMTTTATQFLVTALHGEVQADGSVTYRDDTTRRRYVCPARDLALLSQMLDDPTLSSGDAYSRWCSDTSHAEVAE